MKALPYEYWIAWRYTWARRGSRRDGFISFVSAASMLGIALGVAALIIVLSVMNGFQREVRDRMLSVLPHIEIFAPGEIGAELLADWRAQLAPLLRNPQVKAGAPYVSAQGILARGDAVRGVVLRGIDPLAEALVSDLPRHLKQGSLSDLQRGAFKIILGADLAQSLGVRRGDKVMLVAPQGTISPAGFVPRLRQFTVSGIFSAGHYEYDSSLAFVHLQDAAALFRDTAYSGIRLRLQDMRQAPALAERLAPSLPPQWFVTDWSSQNRTWFSAVEIEKRVMSVILVLIVAVAAFNLLSSLVMTVNDKQGAIAILRSVGATRRSIARIFIAQGVLIGLIGTAIGVSLGLLIACNIDVIIPFLEHLFNFRFLPKEVYLISTLPSDPRLTDVCLIAGLSLLLSFLATLYPSWRAACLEPAEVLRHD